MKKRLLAILLCMVVGLSLCACGDSNTEDTQNNTQNEKEEATAKVSKLADYSDLSVVLSGDYAITQEVLDAYFSDALFDAGAGLIKVTDRDVVQEGDIVSADYTGYVNEKKFQGGSTIGSDGKSNPQWIDVSNNSGFDTATGESTGGFIEGFTDGLVGAKVGEGTSSDVVFPETYDRDTTLDDGDGDSTNDETINLANQPAMFVFVVHEIYVPVTAENITDEFVAEHLSGVYSVNTVAEFMDFIEKEIAYNYIANYLIENSTFEIPDAYLNERLEDYQKYFEEMYCGDKTISEYLGGYGYTVEQMQAEWLQSLQSQIKAELMFAAVVEHAGLALDEAAHQEYINTVLSVNGSYFTDAASIYKYVAAGSVEAGEMYLKNQTAVRDYIKGLYKPAVTE